jgi:hypothetical protein
MKDKELRARLLSEAEKVIDKVLAERPAGDKITLRDIERLAVGAGAELSAGVQQALGEEGSQGQSDQMQRCEKCGAQMQRRGQHGRQVITEAGRSRLERTYYVCPGCGHSFFPLG